VIGDSGSRFTQGKLTFRYPTAPQAIQLFCWALMLVVFWVVYWGEMPLRGVCSLAAVSVYWLFVGCSNIWTWALSFWLRSNRLILDKKGITVGRRFIAWEDITEIGRPRSLAGRAFVRIKDSSPKRSFFDLRACFATRGGPIYLQGYPFVYRYVMPAILSARPDLEVPPFIQRLMKAPEQAMEPRGWLVFSALSVTVALLAAASSTHGRDMFTHVGIAAALLFVPGVVGGLAVPWVKDARGGLVKAALCSPVLVGVAMFMASLGIGKYAALQTLIATSLTMLLAAALVFSLTHRFQTGHQLAVVLLVLAVPLTVYTAVTSAEWPHTDLSPWLSALDIVIWGDDGVYVTTKFSKDSPPVFHLPSMTKVQVPGHGVDAAVLWLNKRHLIRRVEAPGGDELWVFNLERKTEFKLPTAKNWRVGYLQPVEAGGHRLAWLDCGGQWQVRRLRVWNLMTRREVRPPILMPAHVEGADCSVDWIDADNVAVHWVDQNGRLHVLRCNIRTGRTKAMTSAHQYDRWIRIKGFDYAFGVTERGSERCLLTFVRLQTDKAVVLNGIGGYPGLAPDAECSYRVRDLQGKRVLSRFDFMTAKETTVCSVPGHLGLVGVCRSGRTVLLGPSWNGMQDYLVVDVPTSKKHAIRLAGIALPGGAKLLASMPNCSPLSPHGRRIAFCVPGVLGTSGRVVLYTIPHDWP